MAAVIPTIAPQTAAQFGIGWFKYDRSSKKLWYNIGHNLGDATGFYLNGPSAADTQGPNIVRLHDGGDYIISGKMDLDDSSAMYMLLYNGLYVYITSDTFPEGHVRGQLLLQLGTDDTSATAWTHVSFMNGDNMDTKSPATGMALLRVRGNNQLRFKVVHTVTAPGQVLLMKGDRPAGVTLAEANNNARLPVYTADSTTTMTAAQTLLAAGGHYSLRVLSRAYPIGEVSSALIPVSQYRFTVSPDQEVGDVTSTAVGYAVMSYTLHDNAMGYMIYHNVTTPTAAHIHGPADPGENANPVPFTEGDAISTTGTSPISGTRQIKWNEEDFLNGKYYVNVHSTTYANGEIRGQILYVHKDGSSSSDDTGKIVGIVLGTVAGVSMAAGIFVCWRKPELRKRFMKKGESLLGRSQV